MAVVAIFKILLAALMIGKFFPQCFETGWARRAMRKKSGPELQIPFRSDTITILEPGYQQTKIRLAQIDAPEKNQDYGQASKKSLSDLVYGKTVAVDVETSDKYGRTVGKVLTAGTDANLEQVKRGMAWVYRKYAHDVAYYTAEDKAKTARLGLWSRPDAMPPWEFRHGGNQINQPTRAFASQTMAAAPGSGTCGGKRFCKEMANCAEAMHYLKNCGLDKLDKDGDGVPCEALCQ